MVFKVLQIFVLTYFTRNARAQNFNNFLPTSRDQLTCSDAVDFNGVTTQAYTTLTNSGLLFGEKYNGNELEATQFGDLISGEATNPLTVEGGAAGESLQVVASGAFTGITSNALCGVGTGSTVGNGAIAILFDSPQSEVAFDVFLLGATHGLIEVDFKAATGESVELYSYDAQAPIPTAASAAYTRSNAAANPSVTFTGLQIYTALGDGLCIDNIQYCAATPSPVINPTAPASSILPSSFPSDVPSTFPSSYPSSYPSSIPTMHHYPVRYPVRYHSGKRSSGKKGPGKRSHYGSNGYYYGYNHHGQSNMNNMHNGHMNMHNVNNNIRNSMSQRRYGINNNIIQRYSNNMNQRQSNNNYMNGRYSNSQNMYNPYMNMMSVPDDSTNNYENSMSTYDNMDILDSNIP